MPGNSVTCTVFGKDEVMKERIENALNEQLNWELFSSYLYLSMAAHFHSKGLSGFAKWMRVQALEELTHAAKFFDFILERGGAVHLDRIEKPPSHWESPLMVFQEALGHEEKVTERINRLVELAREEKDHATEIFLQWFVTEQVEEEASALDVIQKLKLVGDHPGGLFSLNQELGQRTFVMPTEVKGKSQGGEP